MQGGWQRATMVTVVVAAVVVAGSACEASGDGESNDCPAVELYPCTDACDAYDRSGHDCVDGTWVCPASHPIVSHVLGLAHPSQEQWADTDWVRAT